MLLLVTGASGAGKSTARAHVSAVLAPRIQSVELRDLVAVPAVWTIALRQQAAERAVQRAIALAATGRHLLLAGDPVAAGEVVATPSAEALDGLAVCLLDVSPEAQATRLLGRGDDPSLLVHHQAFARWMREHARDPSHMAHVLSGEGWDAMRWERLNQVDWAMEVLDTSLCSAEQVASAVASWARRALTGQAPTIRLAPDLA